MTISFCGFAQDDGLALFKQNCGACHSLKDQVLVGPSLKGIHEKRNEEWLLKWIKDSQKFIADGDAEAKKIFDEYNKQVMPPFQQLTDQQVKSILAFIKEPNIEDGPKPAEAVTAPVVIKSEPWSPLVWIFMMSLCIVVVVAICYVFSIKYRLKSLGLYSGNIPFRDQVSDWFNKNGRFILIMVILFVLLIMRTCIKQLM